MIKTSLRLLACTAFVAPSLAFAQDAPAQEAPAEEEGLTEIIVTAQKRSEGISRVPISIAAVGGESIEKSGSANLEQVSTGVPNLRITQTGIANRISIRGISSGDNKGFEQSAAMFVDGVYYGRDQLVRMPIMDVERVEVLRGPQPTLFGKNAIAGAISIINKTPDDEFGGSVNASYEFEHKETQLTGVLNLPFSEDSGARLVGYYRKQDGYMFNTKLNRTEPNIDTIALRGTFKLGDGSPVSATLKVEYAKFDVLGQPRESFSPRGTFSAFFTGARAVETNLDWRGESNGISSNTKVFNSTLNIDIEAGSNTVNLTSGYVHYSANEVIDVDWTGLSILDGTNQNDTYDQLSQEIRLTSNNDGPFSYIAGGYFQTSKLSANDNILLGSFLLPLGPPFSRLNDSRSERQFRQTSTLWSGFVQGTYELTDQLRVTAGVRINKETKTGSRNLDIVAGSTNPFDGVIVPPNANYNPRSLLQATWEALRVVEHSISGKVSEDATTPMANIQYDITPELMAYASYAKGVKAGGFDIRSNSLPTTASFPGAFLFKPEKADSYEGGFKYRSRGLSLAISYYNTTYKDLQTSVFDGGIGFNVNNASAAKVQGVEFEGRARISDNIRLSGSVAYLDFKYTDWRQGQCPFGLASNVTGGFCNYTGSRATFAPKWSGSLAADFEYPMGDNLQVSLNINTDFSSSYASGNVLDPFTTQDSFARVGARLALGTIDDGWEIAVVGRNLTNRRVLLTAGQLPLSTTLTGGLGTAYSGIFDRPRNIAVQAQLKF